MTADPTPDPPRPRRCGHPCLGDRVSRAGLGAARTVSPSVHPTGIALVPPMHIPPSYPNALTPTPWNLACSSIAGPPQRQRLPSSLVIESVSASALGCVSGLSRRDTSDE